MTDFMQNAYVFLWGILCVYMLVCYKKIGAVSLVMSAFFLFMTIWFGLRSFAGLAMFDGTLGIIFRCIVGVFLVFFVLVYIFSKRKAKNNSENSQENGENKE